MCRPAEAESEDNGEELSGGHSNYSADRQVEVAADVVLQLVVAALESTVSLKAQKDTWGGGVVRG